MKTKKFTYFVSILFALSCGIFAQEIASMYGYDYRKMLDLNKTSESLLSVDSNLIKIPVGDGKYLEDIQSFDVNLDGSEELIILSNYSGSIQMGQLLVYQWINNQFELLWESAEFSGYPYGMQISDIDNDGLKDILVALSGLKFFKNTGSAFEYKGNLVNQTTDDNFLSGYLDADSLKDLALGSPYFGGGPVRLYKQNPINTTFSYMDTLAGTPGSVMVKSINLNKDMNTDLLTGELYSGDIYIYQNNDEFNFNPIFDHTFNTRIFSIESEDFDNDGYDDFIVAEAWANVHFFKNSGTNNFQLIYSGSNIGSAFNSQACDIDNDGNSDLVVATFDGHVYLYYNLGNFVFREIKFPVSASSNYGLTIGDFDNDGKSDMAFGEDEVFVLFDIPEVINISTSKKPFEILSVKDVPNDQGRKVRIQWSAHFYDDPYTADFKITHYSLWRRYDPHLTLHKSSNTPEGEWDFIKVVPAVQDTVYSTIVSTVADSNIINGQYYSRFFIRAHTSDAAVHFISEPDSGYSVDNLKPLVISGFQANMQENNSVHLYWDENTDSDISHYVLYRDTVSNFVPELGKNSIVNLESLNYLDEDIKDGKYYYYIISAFDLNGNESDFSEYISVILTGLEGKNLPLTIELFQNYPNPFNPATNISFSLPSNNYVELNIYNSNGQKVCNLFNGDLSMGHHTFIWNGKNDKFENVSSGLYFYSFKTSTFKSIKQMLLIR